MRQSRQKRRDPVTRAVRFPRASRWVRALSVVLVAVAAFFGWRHARHRDAPTHPEVDLTTLDPPTLIRRATELVSRGQSYSSLPIYRHLLVLSGGRNEVQLAIVLGVWGFEWEVDDAFRRAALDDPASASFSRMAREHRDKLRNPSAAHTSVGSPPTTSPVVVDRLGHRLQ